MKYRFTALQTHKERKQIQQEVEIVAFMRQTISVDLFFYLFCCVCLPFQYT